MALAPSKSGSLLPPTKIAMAWFAREGFPEDELGRLMELMHTIDHYDLRGLLEPVRRGR